MEGIPDAIRGNREVRRKKEASSRLYGLALAGWIQQLWAKSSGPASCLRLVREECSLV